MSRAVLESEVRTYLAQSALLESRWNTPITARMLDSELRRVTARTRSPERLELIFAALGHDRFLIEECLIRPLLVDRLARQRFAEDRELHAAALSEAHEVHRALLAREIDPHAPHPARSVVELLRG